MATVRVPRGLRTPHLQALREAHLWHQSDLAKEAGVSAMAISRAERGQVVAFETVKRLAAALGCAPDELCRRGVERG